MVHIRPRIAATIAVFGGILAIIVLDPGRNPLIPACPSKTFLDLYCPGCGTIRALYALLHADMVTAMRMNPVTIVFLIYIGALGLARLGERGILAEVLVGKVMTRVWLGGLVLFWVLRNIPWVPFSLLAPGA